LINPPSASPPVKEKRQIPKRKALSITEGAASRIKELMDEK
jgi:hypothetical protein